MNTLDQFGPLLGRILIATIYLISGFQKTTGFESTVGFIASKGLPLPQIAAIGAIIAELGGGTNLAIGWNARWAAVALFVFTAVAGLIFHNFWAAPAVEASNQMTHFLKNVCILGGLVYVIVHGSGPLSIEGGHGDSPSAVSQKKGRRVAFSVERVTLRIGLITKHG